MQIVILIALRFALSFSDYIPCRALGGGFGAFQSLSKFSKHLRYNIFFRRSSIPHLHKQLWWLFVIFILQKHTQKSPCIARFFVWTAILSNILRVLWMFSVRPLTCRSQKYYFEFPTDFKLTPCLQTISAHFPFRDFLLGRKL